jgi:hypothetical protein
MCLAGCQFPVVFNDLVGGRLGEIQQEADLLDETAELTVLHIYFQIISLELSNTVSCFLKQYLLDCIVCDVCSRKIAE